MVMRNIRYYSNMRYRKRGMLRRKYYRRRYY